MTCYALRNGILVAIAGAWAAIALLRFSESVNGSVLSVDQSAFVCRFVPTESIASQPFASRVVVSAIGSFVMAIAMMAPTALPAARFVASNSYKRLRPLAVATFFSGFLAIWSGYGILAEGVLSLSTVWTSHMPGLTFTVFILALAALWQFTPLKDEALRACHSGPILAVNGRQAFVSYARFGLSHGLACVSSCWLLMLAAQSAHHAAIVLMIAISGLIWVERIAPRRRLSASGVAAGIVGLAGASVVFAS